MADEIAPESQLPRNVEPLLHETLADTPITVLQGARQVGKTTLVEKVVAFRGGVLYNLDEAATLEAARRDPDGFVRQPVDGVLALDEVQRAPELIRAAKAAVDADRRPGRFLFTGSSDLLHVSGAEESLAGRAETVPLYGLSQGEVRGTVEDFVAATCGEGAPDSSEPLDRADYARIVCAGSYPEALARQESRRRERWYENYLRRVLEHDATESSRLIHVDRLKTLIGILAAEGIGELVKARLSRASDIPETSLPPYLRLLEDLGLVHRIPAWRRNRTQRVVGRPECALLDTGLASHLAGLGPESLSRVAGRDHLGGLLEAFVAGELRRQQGWSRESFEIHHYRERDGHEVDLVCELRDGRLIGIEVKSARSASSRDFRGLERLRARAGEAFVAGVVLHTGPSTLPFGPGLWSSPISALWTSGQG